MKSQFSLPATLFLAIIVLTGCAGTVTVSDSYPTPVVDPLPYSVGYVIDNEFRNYTYVDEDNKLDFALGPQQSALYAQVFEAIFERATEVSDKSEQSFDLLLEPRLVEYGYLSPEDSASKFFAASMKYQIRIFDSNGDALGYWQFTAYGKSRTKLLGRNQALGEATSTALRDAAAAIVTRFRAAVEKQDWTKEQTEDTESDAQTAAAQS